MRHKATGKLDLLILDELGYVPASKLGSELLFEIISTAYERTSVIVTTNLPVEQWTEVLGSERLTGAVLDRLTHRCHILEASGESYRLKDARRSSTDKRAAERLAKPPEKDQSRKVTLRRQASVAPLRAGGNGSTAGRFLSVGRRRGRLQQDRGGYANG